jgi:hypothetical protein
VRETGPVVLRPVADRSRVRERILPATARQRAFVAWIGARALGRRVRRLVTRPR